MRIFTSLEEIQGIGETAVALGNFDGVHRGHQALIARAVEIAREKSLKAAVFTFTNHPVNVVSGKNRIKNIMDSREKAEAVAKYGVDYLFSVDFDAQMMTSPPELFCREVLRNRLRCRAAVCGFNYSFGYKAAGDPAALKAWGEALGYDTYVINPVYVKGQVVSSTVIRSAIDEGRVDAYLEYTGRPYDIEGIVIHGKHIGRRIGFPTVNLALSSEMAQPHNGVYITKTYVDLENGGVCFPSITNVGNKPTVGIFDKNAETHIFGFDRDIYGEKIRVEFIKMVRPEQKFASLDALQEQIHADCLQVQAWHRENGGAL